MRKFLLGIAILGLSSFMATSCLDNTEPAGIEDLRNAKSELIRAQAAYEQARIALIEAEAAMQEALTQGQLLENQIKELELRQKELDLEYQEAWNEHQIKLMELEYLLRQEENNAAIEELKMQIAELEILQMQLDLEKQRIELEKETMVQQHELELLELQTKLAQAQATYDQTLRDIEAAKHGLSDVEQNKLDQYINQIDMIQAQLDGVESDLINAQNTLVDLKYGRGYDSLILHQQYVNNVNEWQREVDNLNAEIEEVRGLDLTGGTEELMAEVESIDNEIAGLNSQIAQIRIDADAKAYEKIEPEAVKAELQDSIDLVNEEINDLMEQIYSGGDKSELDYYAIREIAITDPIASIVGGAIQSAIYDLIYNNSIDIDIISDFEYVNFKYALPSGVFSWKAREIDNYNYILPALTDAVSQYVLSDPAIQNLRDEFENFRLNLEQSRFYETYDHNLNQFRQAREEYTEFAAEYGIINRNYYESDNLMTKALEAAAELQTLVDEGTALDGSAVQTTVTAALNTIRQEQEVRDTLFNNAYDGWELITYANLTSDATEANHIDINFVMSAVQNSNYNYNSSLYDIWSSYEPEYNADTTAWSILQRWNETSQYLYALEFEETEMTTETYKLGEYVGFEFSPNDIYNPYILYLTDPDIVDQYYRDLGYASGANDFLSSSTFSVYYYQFIEESVTAYFDNLTELPALTGDIQAMYDELAAVGVIDNETIKGLYEKVLELNNKIVDLYARIAEQDDIITQIDLEIQEINSQEQTLNNQISRLNTTKGIIENIIMGVEIEIDGTIYNPLTDDLEGIRDARIEVLQGELESAELELEKANANLERLENADDPGAVAIEDAERRVEDLQEQYDSLLERFNFYNDLLSDFLTNIIGAEA